MIFNPLKLQGTFLIELDLLKDSRGFFARSFCQQAFEKRGLDTTVKQCNISFNYKKGTIRGMHYQAAPYEEAKLVRCTKGSIHDVIVDIRPSSPTFKQWVSVILSRQNQSMLYIPRGFAHGFQTLENDVEVFYQMFDSYKPESTQGLRWNDPSINIGWPLPVTEISDKDSSYEDFVL